MSKKGRVFVGMSGGVDSSVTAALLKMQGYDVVGVFIRAWEPFDNTQGRPSNFVCTWREDRRDAMRVAAHLGIPFTTLNLEQEYKQLIVDEMIAEYRAGRTPNPDVMCNKHIKFGHFYDRAIKAGADFIATGHYARVEISNAKYQKTNWGMFKSIDQDKDQTYFLWNIRQAQLNHILFPIGNYLKSEVRALAHKFKLPTAEKKDSQGLCFVGKIDIKEFLKQYIENKPGEVVDERGAVIGRHDGIYFYTLGERHGFTIDQPGPTSKPYYVIAKDIDNNRLIVSHTPRPLGETSRVKLEQANWITEPQAGVEYHARARYREPLTSCKLQFINNETSVEFNEPKLLPSGQSLVIYSKENCLGGGIIA